MIYAAGPLRRTVNIQSFVWHLPYFHYKIHATQYFTKYCHIAEKKTHYESIHICACICLSFILLPNIIYETQYKTNWYFKSHRNDGRRVAIICTNAWILLIGSLGTKFSENFIKIYTFSFKKIYLKMLCGNGGHIVSPSMCSATFGTNRKRDLGITISFVE